MPAVWQKWMPLHIDKLWSSPEVQRMHGWAFKGYMSLITAQWQSDDCTITSSVENLAVISRLSDEQWAEHSPAILRKFPVEGDGLRNGTCYEQWMEAKARYEEGQLAYEQLKAARSVAGKYGAQVREGKRKQGLVTNQANVKQGLSTAEAELKQTPSKAEAKSSFTYTETYTDTEKQVLLASHPSGDSAEIPFVELPTNRRNLHFPVYESHILDWIALYPAVDARQQVRNMRGWLDGNPEHRKTLRGTPAFIHRWLSKAQDKGGSVGTQPGSIGSRGLVSPASQRVESGVNAFRQAGERLGITAARGVDGTDGGPLSPPGHRAGSGELLVRHAALAGEVRVQGGGDSTPDFAHKAKPEILPPSDRSSGGVRSYGG